MSPKKRSEADPLEHSIELALKPEAFIPDRVCFAFVSGLENVASRIARLIDTDSVRATVQYETFLAICNKKRKRSTIRAATSGNLSANCSEALHTFYIAQKNAAAYIALAEETGLTSRDCHSHTTR